MFLRRWVGGVGLTKVAVAGASVGEGQRGQVRSGGGLLRPESAERLPPRAPGGLPIPIRPAEHRLGRSSGAPARHAFRHLEQRCPDPSIAPAARTADGASGTALRDGTGSFGGGTVQAEEPLGENGHRERARGRGVRPRRAGTRVRSAAWRSPVPASSRSGARDPPYRSGRSRSRPEHSEARAGPCRDRA